MLAILLFLKVLVEVNEVVTGLLGMCFIAASVVWWFMHIWILLGAYSGGLALRGYTSFWSFWILLIRLERSWFSIYVASGLGAAPPLAFLVYGCSPQAPVVVATALEKVFMLLSYCNYASGSSTNSYGGHISTPSAVAFWLFRIGRPSSSSYFPFAYSLLNSSL